ncbi:metallophosphoesterase [Corynebacterium breve]|uniref:Metallophosphoesterase n=1 Tax=Corynebacterium breve TaxID=3049799 RepID=A0ABY8VKH7_9CORY|nr:metallophosphoesterase [Corynebacterium breve]WIM68733.1 metallophosphoesterase [Corynebacterium breve]
MSSRRRVPATVLALATALSFVHVPAIAEENAPSVSQPAAPQPGFRVLPYLMKPASDQMTINFFTELGNDATVTVTQSGEVVLEEQARGEYQENLQYTQLELEQEIEGLDKGSWLKSNDNYKYSVTVSDLAPNTTYNYTVTVDEVEYSNAFTTAPTSDEWDNIRVIAFSDSETEPAGRPKVSGAREWERNRTFAEGSLDRPGAGSAWFEKFGSNNRQGQDEPRYPLTQDEAFRHNLGIVEAQNPDLLMVAGDLTQGSGYQPAWDEYMGYVAGENGDIAASTPMLTALGNWETFGALNGSYSDENGVAHGAHKGRAAYQTYIDTFGSDNPDHADSYYRVDHGPLTIITLDSTNGLPDENYDEVKQEQISGNDKDIEAAGAIGTDTNTSYSLEGIQAAGNTDQPDFGEGSEQWVWAEKQLADAREAGQYVVVQFHHAAYSNGVHGTATRSATPDAQPGTPMRVYTPMFEKYGVAAVISGHDEMFERSWVDMDGDGVGFHSFDVGVAADGLRGDYRQEVDGEVTPVNFNTYSEWMAQADEPENWQDVDGVRQLIDGGKHYGHLQMDLEPVECADGGTGAKLTTTPVYAFPVLDSDYNLVEVERREYNDVQSIFFNADGTPAPRGSECSGADIDDDTAEEPIDEPIDEPNDDTENSSDDPSFLGKLITFLGLVTTAFTLMPFSPETMDKIWDVFKGPLGLSFKR